jgi:nitrogen-specific signal transduction histidine kinase/CheY-like chemotaxis protein
MKPKTTKIKTVLVVDDTDKYREGLLNSLQKEGLLAYGARSGEEAIMLMEKNPQQYQFAVIDHFLNSGIDGIQTTKELFDRNQNLFALVFTNVPSDDPEEIMKFKYKALEAGAYRYLERGPEREAPKKVKDFINEIEQLAILKGWIQNYYENREQVPSLLTQLNIGVDIIDRSYKVWFMNDALRRITGLHGQELPRKGCSMWHGYCFLPCPGCIVKETFSNSASKYHIFLSPFVNRDKEKLFFLNVWTQPIRDRKNNIVYASDGKPLAVMESVQDLTGTAQLREMSIDERLMVIADSLRNRPVQGKYLGEIYFKKVEIFTKEEHGNNFILKAASGFDPELKLGGPVDFNTEEYLKIAEKNMRESGFGYFFAETERAIYWPVIMNNRTIAVIRTMGTQYSNQDSVPFVKPYAEEVSAAIQDTHKTDKKITAEFESIIGEIDFKLQLIASPKEGLQTLVKSACELTDSNLALLRYREEDSAVLLRLKLKDFGDYERIALPSNPLSHNISRCSQTIISGQEYIANMISSSSDIIERRQKLPKENQDVLNGSQAECFEPLLLHGRCIGVLELYSKDPNNYSNEKKLYIIRAIARRMALALHDYLVDQKAQKRVQKTQNDTIGIVLHNINTPLGVIRVTLGMLKKHIEQKYHSDDYGFKQLNDIERQIEKISKIREEFLRLQKEWESRIEKIDLHEAIRNKVGELIKAGENVSVEYQLNHRIKNIQTDAAAINVCIEVLMQNALDGLEHIKKDKHIKISIRSLIPNEISYLSSSKPGFAIDVEDNGSGVPSEMIKDLFKIIRTGKAKGLGFGLTFCRKVARSAHGDVYYNETYKNGTKFTLVLPYESD